MNQVQVITFKSAARRRRLAREINESLSATLERFAHAIRDVRVRVSDINGPRGGVDKLCRVLLRLKSRGVVVATGKGMTEHHAAHAAIQCLGKALPRRLSRRREISRKWNERKRQRTKGEE